MKRTIFLIAALAALPSSASAGLNVPVAARVISFVQPAPSGIIRAAIVFEPGSAASEAEAALIEQQIGGGMASGRGMIHVRRVAATSPSALAGVQVAFITTGVRGQQQIAESASRGSILTITSDLACVQAGRCTVAITGTAQPQITISRAAAKATGIRFGSAFLMLVKEL